MEHNKSGASLATHSLVETPLADSLQAHGVSARWHALFEQLRAWRLQHRTCSVPKSQGRLGRWVARQRELYKRSEMQPARRDALDKLGIVWDPSQAQWMLRFGQLQAYLKANGSVCVPTNDRILGAWMAKQRKLHGKNRLRPDRYNLLVELGVVFKPAMGKKRNRDAAEAAATCSPVTLSSLARQPTLATAPSAPLMAHDSTGWRQVPHVQEPSLDLSAEGKWEPLAGDECKEVATSAARVRSEGCYRCTGVSTMMSPSVAGGYADMSRHPDEVMRKLVKSDVPSNGLRTTSSSSAVLPVSGFSDGAYEVCHDGALRSRIGPSSFIPQYPAVTAYAASTSDKCPPALASPSPCSLAPAGARKLDQGCGSLWSSQSLPSVGVSSLKNPETQADTAALRSSHGPELAAPPSSPNAGTAVPQPVELTGIWLPSKPLAPCTALSISGAASQSLTRSRFPTLLAGGDSPPFGDGVWRPPPQHTQPTTLFAQSVIFRDAISLASTS